eukprot:scaffold18458_cov112-Isochrysis_galbana.AAC.1
MDSGLLILVTETAYRGLRIGMRMRMRVGECLVGRHASGMAVERCVVFGVGRVGSVWLPGFCVVGRWIGHHCFTCGFLSSRSRPHTMIPLPCGVGVRVVWWGPVGPTSPVCASKTPHAPERGVGRPPRDSPPPSEHEHEVQ